MIKELLLSLAVVAASGVSSFVGSPKRAVLPSELNNLQGDYSLSYLYDENEELFNLSALSLPGNFQYESSFLGGYDFAPGDDPIEIYRGGDFVTQNAGSLIITFYSSGGDSNFIYFEWGEFSSSTVTEFSNNFNDYLVTISGGVLTDKENLQYTVKVEFKLTNASGSFSFTLGDTLYNLTKNFVNCDIASSPRLPDTFTSSGQLSYYVLMVSNAGGYGFTAQSVTQTGGITIRNFSLFDQYNNSGYYASCSFNVDLPLNNCSLSVTAFLPQYTITANLERCTVYPAIPNSYTGTSFSGDYTFTAVSGYGFNKNYTHWEVSNLFIDSVEFSALLWGSFYSSVTLHIRASGGNSSISVTAIKYDEENYKLGYEEGREDGFQAGYDRGHADGEIAGNSYGVWNWLKQAALTTGEFLSIPLLPGFSIGGLLTALAGLVIIWFFIKGFLFKS